jgi:hypothetical protein
MRVLISGGTQFIGPPAVRRLHELGHDALVFHRGETEADLPALPLSLFPVPCSMSLAVCRSIKTLRQKDGRAPDDEIGAAALQFVRKISGYRKPSRLNEAAFDAAVDEISAASRRLLDALTTR